MNGSPREFFESTRGIWQGVLLSPILFLVLLWKLLIGLISKAVEQGYLSGFPAETASNALMKISQLFIMDDYLIFCDAASVFKAHP